MNGLVLTEFSKGFVQRITNQKQLPGPCARYFMLRIPCLVEGGAEEGDGAHHDGGKAD